MEDLDLADPELAILINIPENKICNDCQKKNPRWCSINNAVFLCPSCARKHRKFNKNISTIKSIEGDLWTKDEIKKLCIGGNERFNKLMSSYNIPITLDNAKYKYHTRIADYYRNLLNEEIKEKKIIDIIKPSLKEGIELISKDEYDKLNQYAPSQDNIIQNNNNFNNEVNYNNNNSKVLNEPKKENIYVNPFASEFPNQNQNINHNSNNYNNCSNTNSNNNKKDEFDIEKHLNNFADSMNNVFTNISHKASSIDYNQKLKNAEEFLKDKKEKIENSDTFKGFMNAISKGFDNFVGAAENFLNNNFDEYEQPRRNENSFDNRNQNQVQFQGQRINNINNSGNLNDNHMSSNMNFSVNNNNMNPGNLNNTGNNENIKLDNENTNLNFFENTPMSGSNMYNFQPRIENINVVGENNDNNNVENLDDDNGENK